MPTEKEIIEALEKGILLSPKVEEVKTISGEKIEAKGGSRENSKENNETKVNSRKTTNENIEGSKEESRYKKYNIEFLKRYEDIFKKRSYHDFFTHFLIRYKNIENLLKTRTELKSLTSISRLQNRSEKENVSIIAMVKDKFETKKGNIRLIVEDPTGEISVLLKKNENGKATTAEDISLDEIIGINGTLGNNIIFSNKIVHPDIPLTHELKKHPDEIYAAVLGDMHFGSSVFLQEEFDKLISWLKGDVGSDEQKAIAKKIKYIFMIGDLIEGLGIYPGQEEHMDSKFHDIKVQYDLVAEMLKKIPDDKVIIMCPGNHDYGRLAEPQLPLTSDYSSSIDKIKNVIQVSNPAFINFAKTEDFPGFNLLMYHGGSLIYYCENVPSIRQAGGQKAVNLTMKYLLQRRHLAPTHKSNLYIPDPEKDFLFIDTIPDFFVTGHIHRANIDSYRNVTMVSGSCWTGKTENMEKRGLEPQMAKLPVINLRTREIKLINFLKKEHEGVIMGR
jgi:DNA polymerase II small subunit